IDPLDLAGDEAVADVADPGPAIGLRDGGAEQAERPHLGHDGAVEDLVAVGLEDARHQLVLAVGPRGVADHARSEEHTSELQSLMRISYAVFRLKKKSTL